MAGQPVLTVLLAIAVVFLWRDLQKEREARVSMVRETIAVTNSVTTALDKLTDAIRNGKQ
jgi:hypothetical protein